MPLNASALAQIQSSEPPVATGTMSARDKEAKENASEAAAVEPRTRLTEGITKVTEAVRQHKKGAQNITVAVRVRPLTAQEKSRNAFPTIKVLDEAHICVSDPDDKMGGLDYLRLDKNKTKHYCFDHSFGPEAEQAEVFEKTAKELVPKVVEGYNACCFAYGATGAGKTFTMMGNLEQSGVIPLTLEGLMQLISASNEETYKVSMQYVEIYNEKIKDLLNPSDANLDVREVPSRGTYVAGASEELVSSSEI